MNSVSNTFNARKLLITRKIGFKELIPDSGQWKLSTDPKDEECWVCTKAIMTVFIWTPRVGQLSASKDVPSIKHYEEVLKQNRTKLSKKEQPQFMDLHPQI